MSDETETTCDRCGTTYLYAPRFHKCPEQWAQECEDAGASPMQAAPSTTWAEECLEKVKRRVR